MAKAVVRALIQIYNLARRVIHDILHHNCIESSGVHWRVSKNTYHVEVRAGTWADEHVHIGAYTYVGRRCTLSKCAIGRYCSIGDGVIIGPGDHPTEQISTSAYFCEYRTAYDSLTREECTVGNDVWIGAHAIILRGVAVGDGAVIGANAVVTKDVPPFGIACGVPARLLRLRLSEEVRRQALSSRWWERDLKDAEAAIKELDRAS